MTAPDIIIRPLSLSDRPAWQGLWQGYLDFYGTTLGPGQTVLTWQRLHDPLEPLHGLGAEVDGRLAGFALWLVHRSTWALHGYAYLEDLFVAADLRGRGAGRALVEAVCAEADRLGLERVYWVTEADNPARTLYDQVARLTGFVQYRR